MDRRAVDGPGRDSGKDSMNPILEHLSDLGEVAARPLFGGHGLYWRDTIFAIAYGGRLYPQGGRSVQSRLRGPWHGAVPPERAADPQVLLRGAPGCPGRSRGPA